VGGSGNNFSENASLRGQEYAVEVRVDLYQDVSICEDTLVRFRQYSNRLHFNEFTMGASAQSPDPRNRAARPLCCSTPAGRERSHLP